jgi:hypothetical protein
MIGTTADHDTTDDGYTFLGRRALPIQSPRGRDLS